MDMKRKVFVGIAMPLIESLPHKFDSTEPWIDLCRVATAPQDLVSVLPRAPATRLQRELDCREARREGSTGTTCNSVG